MQLKLADMPDDTIEHYKLRDVATPDRYVYCEIQKGMYGLPQAGIIAQELLTKRLKEHGYSQSEITPGLWKQEWRPITFSLVDDDFGVKYVGEGHAQHLLQTIQKYYQCSVEKEGERYCGLTIKWDYPGKKVHLSMPAYIKNALKRFQHPPQSYHKINRTPTFISHMGKKCSMRQHPMTPSHSTSWERSFFQEVTGVFLFLARAVDSTMLTPSAPLRPNKRRPLKKLCKNVCNSWTTWHRRMKPS
jgi:hypothetical protein